MEDKYNLGDLVNIKFITSKKNVPDGVKKIQETIPWEIIGISENDLSLSFTHKGTIYNAKIEKENVLRIVERNEE